jgi:hypothetical protein
MGTGVILLGEVAARTDSITVVCRLCPRRRGWLRTDRLLAEYGPHMPMPDCCACWPPVPEA